MCRLVGYLGSSPLPLENLLTMPSHSLVVQSYQPQEMTAGLLNADGFGIGWYELPQLPFTYKNSQPIWSDINLAHLGRYVRSQCILANVRSATPGQSVDLVNCQPFRFGQVMGIHNGYIDDFRRSLYRLICDHLADQYYQNIHGNTDSEHILGLCFQALAERSMVAALEFTLTTLAKLCADAGVAASLNLVISDGEQMVASRYATRSPAPSLYFLKDQDYVMVASEPLFAHPHWQSLPEHSLLAIAPNFSHQILAVDSSF